MYRSLHVTPRLGDLLNKFGLTQMELSNMCGVPQPSISRFDKSERHNASHLFAISQALGITIEELFIVEYVDENRKKGRY